MNQKRELAMKYHCELGVIVENLCIYNYSIAIYNEAGCK